MRRPLLLSLALAGCPAADSVDVLTFTSSDGVERMTIPIDALEVGIVERGSEDVLSYSPTYADKVVLQWRSPETATRDGSVVSLVYGDDLSATVEVVEVDAGRWDLHWIPSDASRIGFFRITAEGDASEGFYGLGEYFDHPHHRGQIRDMQIEPSGATESGYNEAHVPIPLIIGTTGWGLFVADDHLMRFEVATEADDAVRVTVGTGVDSAAGLRLHVYTADHPLDITRRYYDTTGYPALPAPWALGPMLWRDENTGQDEVEADLEAMRDLDLPASAIWIDRPYASAVNSFDFHPDDYSDPQGMIDRAHELGFRVGLWHTPYAEESSGAIHDEAVAGGYFPPLVPAVVLAVVNWGPLIDLTNPAAFDWWTALIRRYTSMGVEGFKLDFAEDVVPALLEKRLAWTFHDGSDERTMHRQYQRLYHQAYRDALEGPGFLLCRAGAWGDQTITSIIWPGDIDGNLALHGEDMGEYVAVGGLPAAVVASLSLGPSGYPFFGSDTGGYRHTPPDKETFTRWFQHTALSTVMQIGMSSSDVAWEYVRDWDDEMLDWYREYTRLHLRLVPYIWTYAEQIAETGHPIQRPLGLAHPELGEHFDFDYLFGEHLLVAPVVRPGERTRRVVLPAGRWVDWFDGDVLEAGEHTVDAPLGKLPLFLREGGLVPLLRSTIDTLAPVSEPDVIDSFATDPGELTVRLFPGGNSEFTLYDGTRLWQSLEGDQLTVGYEAGSVFVAGARFEVLGAGGLVTVPVETGTVTVTLGD